MRKFFAALAACLVVCFGQPSAASVHSNGVTGSSVEIAASCYSQDLAISDEEKSSSDAAGDQWLSTDIVQMSLRQISLLVDDDPSLQGYETSVSGQLIAVVHDQASGSDQIVPKIRQAMARGVADIENGSRSDFPSVVLYPACDQLEHANGFDELEDLIGSADWTDEPVFEEVGLAMERDLTTTQVVLTLEESTPTTDRIATQLLGAFGSDVRVEFDPTHPMFNWEILALPGSQVEPENTDDVAQEEVRSSDAAEAGESQTSVPAADPRGTEPQGSGGPTDQAAAGANQDPDGGQGTNIWLVATLGMISSLVVIGAWKAGRPAS